MSVAAARSAGWCGCRRHDRRDRGPVPAAAEQPGNAQITTNQAAGQNSFADVVEKVSPAVVSVKIKKDVNARNMASNEDGMFGDNVPPQIEKFLRRFGFENGPGGQMPRPPRGENGGRQVVGQGSGFNHLRDGYVVTNNHVVDGASEVDVTTTDGKDYVAKVIGTDPRTDVALLKIDGKTNLPWVKLADAPPRVGDWVIAVGNPFGLGRHRHGRHRLRPWPRHRRRPL